MHVYTQGESDSAEIAMIVRYINAFTQQCQVERGMSAQWVGSKGTNGNPPYDQREKVDKKIEEFMAFVTETHYHAKISRKLLLGISLVEDFFRSIIDIRYQVYCAFCRVVCGVCCGVFVGFLCSVVQCCAVLCCVLLCCVV